MPEMQSPPESAKKLRVGQRVRVGDTSSQMRVGQRVRVGDALYSSEPPVVTTLDDICKGQLCHHCFKKGQLTPCPGCKCDSYCSDTCRSAARLLHQHECPYLPALLRGGFTWRQRLLLKLVIKLKNGGDEEWFTIDDQLRRQFHHMAKHPKHYRADQDLYRGYEVTKTILTKHLPRGFLPSDDALFDMFVALAVNMTCINNHLGDSIGLGLYMSVSICNHSCRPNVTYAFDGCMITIRSLVDMPNYHRDKVFFPYCEPLEPYEQRQKLLWKYWCFECKCDRCTDDFASAIEGAICCGNPTCPYPIEVPARLLNPPTPGLECELTPVEEAKKLSCPRCGYSDFAPSVLADYKELLERYKTTTEEMNNGEPSLEDEGLISFAWHQLLRLQQREKKGRNQLILYPLNIYWVQLLNAAALLAIETSHLEKALNFYEMSIQGMQYYCGRNGRQLGLTYYSMAKICIYLQRIKPALRHLKEAEKILKITFGPEHPLFVDELYPLIDAAKAVKTVRKSNISLRTYRSCAKRVARMQKHPYNWLYWSFGGLLLTMIGLGVSGVSASSLA